MKIKQSETLIINRSQINLNPYNPKKHTEEAIKRQKRNFQKVGFLGGVTWNKLSGNLIDGHRRVFAMDLINNYNGTPDTDYQLKIEAVELNDKQEREQMTYMAVGNTKADINLIKEFSSGLDLDFSDIGFTTWELDFLNDCKAPQIETFDFGFNNSQQQEQQPIDKEEAEARKEHMKDVKQQSKEKAIEYTQNQTSYFTCSFSTYEAKTAFLEMLGFDPNAHFVKGEELLEKLDL